MPNADHDGRVKAWLERAGKDATAPSLLLQFEATWNALCRRAESAVGEIALESIAKLVHSKSLEKFPILSPLKVEANGISCKALSESSNGLDRRELEEALRFMLLEFLTVIANLTDQILTPALYDELSRAKPESQAQPPEIRDAHSLEEPSMATKEEFISTGIPNLDDMLAGGLIKGSSTAIAGLPGSGKTILAQQIAFHNASPDNKVLFFSTLSEPGAKSLFYLSKLGYFDKEKIGESIHFVDLGILLRAKGLPEVLETILKHLKKVNPAIVMVDSFKVFQDMTTSPDELRKFSYELIINLMARNCTSLFLGEYSQTDLERNPVFSIIDGLMSMTQRELGGEQQRFIKIIKMRGLAHSRDEHAFRITSDGIEIYASRLTVPTNNPNTLGDAKASRCQIGIPKLDDLLGGGIPRGSSLLITGSDGTGKTVLGLEFIYRGALAGEKGVVFSFEETDERLRAAARGLGWDLDKEIERGMVQIVFVAQPDVMVERDLAMIRQKIAAMGATRVALDSLSVFLHKMNDQQLVREKVFQLVSVVQNAGAVGFFTTDIPYGSTQISHFGVEETVVDGVVILSSTEEGMERERYIEVYKLRNTAHLKGRHTMTIAAGGIQIFPRYRPQDLEKVMPPPAKIPQRLPSGIAGLDKLLGSGLLAKSVTLVSGSSGIGKSILSLQFLLEGASRGEPGLYVTLEEGPEELLANAAALGLPLQKAVDSGLVDIIYLPPTHIRSTQLLALLTDRIKQKKTLRLVLDSTTHIVASGMSRDDVRELLYDMSARFKNLGVTCVFTLESDLMYSTDSSTDTYRGFAPLADNVIVLRYLAGDNQMLSTLMVVKSRGSTHDKGLYSFTIGKGGVLIGPSLTITGPTGDISGPTGDQQAQAAASSKGA